MLFILFNSSYIYIYICHVQEYLYTFIHMRTHLQYMRLHILVGLDAVECELQREELGVLRARRVGALFEAAQDVGGRHLAGQELHVGPPFNLRALTWEASKYTYILYISTWSI